MNIIALILIITAAITYDRSARAYQAGCEYHPAGTSLGGSFGRDIVTRSAQWRSQRLSAAASVTAGVAALCAIVGGAGAVVALVVMVIGSALMMTYALRLLGTRGRRDIVDWSR